MTYPGDITPDFFYSGLSIEQYVEGMTKNRELFEANYASFRLTDEEQRVLASLRDPLHIFVLTEDWCGDSIRYLPVLARMAEAAGNWDLRIFYREQYPEWGKRWLKHGTRSAIPVLVFLDSEWREHACFVEKPEPVYDEEDEARTIFASDHRDLSDAALPAGEMSQSTLDIFAPYMRAFRLNNTEKWQHYFATELTARLQSAATGEVVGAGCW